MSVISIKKLYDNLNSSLGNENAEAVITYIDHKINTEMENKLKLLSTKEDLRATKEDLRNEISRLEVRLGETKVDLIKWMVGICVALGMMMMGLYFRK